MNQKSQKQGGQKMTQMNTMSSSRGRSAGLGDFSAQRIIFWVWLWVELFKNYLEENPTNPCKHGLTPRTCYLCRGGRHEQNPWEGEDTQVFYPTSEHYIFSDAEENRKHLPGIIHTKMNTGDSAGFFPMAYHTERMNPAERIISETCSCGSRKISRHEPAGHDQHLIERFIKATSKHGEADLDAISAIGILRTLKPFELKWEDILRIGREVKKNPSELLKYSTIANDPELPILTPENVDEEEEPDFDALDKGPRDELKSIPIGYDPQEIDFLDENPTVKRGIKFFLSHKTDIDAISKAGKRLYKTSTRGKAPTRKVSKEEAETWVYTVSPAGKSVLFSFHAHAKKCAKEETAPTVNLVKGWLRDGMEPIWKKGKLLFEANKTEPAAFLNEQWTEIWDTYKGIKTTSAPVAPKEEDYPPPRDEDYPR
jgi:hypothetical protein